MLLPGTYFDKAVIPAQGRSKMAPPIRFTLESFEDVAGYPGKVFYALHQYPGTGCPQVPFIAIDKTEEGNFKIRELDQSPVEEFKDEKYKYNWPRDPRLKYFIDKNEEVMSTESLPSTNDKSSAMPVIQDVKSVEMDFFNKNKCTQGLMAYKDGHSVELNVGSKTSPAESESCPKPLFWKALPLSPRIWTSFPLLNKVGDSVNQNAITSGTSSPVIFDESVTSKPAKIPKLLDMKPDNIPNKSIDMVNQNASTPRTSLLVIIDDGVASKKTGGSKSFDTKVNVASKNKHPLNQKANSSKTLLLEVEDSMVRSKTTGGAVSVDTKIDDVPNKLTDTVIKEAGTSRSVFIDERLGKNETVVPESSRVCERSLPVLSCTSDFTAQCIENKLPESPSPLIESILIPNKPTLDSILKAEHGVDSCCDTSSGNTVSCSPVSYVAPIDSKHPEKTSPILVATVAETHSSSVKSVQPPTIPKEVTPHNKIVREISSLVSDILSEHVRSSDQPNDPNVNIADNSVPKTPTVIIMSETASTKKDSSTDKLNTNVGTSERYTSHEAVVKEISSIVTGIISGHMKSSDRANDSTMPKINKSKSTTQCSSDDAF